MFLFEEVIGWGLIERPVVRFAPEPGERPARVFDMIPYLVAIRRVGEECFQVRDTLLRAFRTEQDERKTIVRAGCRRILLKDVPVGLGGLLDHPDARVAHRDLLEHHRITRRLFEGETERGQGLVSLPSREEILSLAIVVDPIGAPDTEELYPERRGRGGGEGGGMSRGAPARDRPEAG